MYWGALLFVFLYLAGLMGFALAVTKILEPSLEAIKIEEEKEDE